MSHNFASDYKVVFFEIDGEQSIFIADVKTRGITPKEYYNIFGYQLIYSTSNAASNFEITKEEYLTSYLALYDKVQSEYSEQDLKEVLELIKNDYEKEDNKQLVK